MPYITLENGQKVKISQESYDELKKAVGNKRWRAKFSEEYWYIHDNCSILSEAEYNYHLDNARWKSGNYYRTEEEAEKARDRQLALMRLKDWALTNTPFEPDWKDLEQEKWNVYYDYNFDILSYNVSFHTKHQTELPYFKSMEDVRRFIEENEEDLKIVFGVEEK